MSWQPYIDDHLMAELPHGGHLEHAAIMGHSGDIWAQSPSFPEVTQDEAEAILAGFDNQAKLAEQGLYIAGVKYIVIAGEEGAVIRGQKGRDSMLRFSCMHLVKAIFVHLKRRTVGQSSFHIQSWGLVLSASLSQETYFSHSSSHASSLLLPHERKVLDNSISFYPYLACHQGRRF